MCCVWNASSSRSSRWAGLLGRKAAGEEAVALGAGDGEYSVELFAADLVDSARGGRDAIVSFRRPGRNRIRVDERQ